MLPDNIISDLYAAAAGRIAWRLPFEAISEWLGLWVVQVVGVNKRTGALIFSGEGGPATPQAALDYIRFYHAINPRMAPMLATPSGHWMHCHEHFDETYVAASPFYQEFLIPHGGRYMTATKLLEDDDTLYLLGFFRGYGSDPIYEADMPLLEQTTHHLREAFKNLKHARSAFVELSVARQLLSQFDYPMFLIDDESRILHMNRSAQLVIARQDVVGEKGGILYCLAAQNNRQLSVAIADLDLSSAAAAVERRVVALMRSDGSHILAFINGMDPSQMMGMFGEKYCVLVMLHDPLEARTPLDAFIVAECFQLTPAEAKVALHIVSGATPKEIAQRCKIGLPTVRTHLQRVMNKTGTTRQAELVSTLLALPARKLPRTRHLL